MNDIKKLLKIRPSLISQLALMTDDTEYKDFGKPIYEQAILKANRNIAKKYEIVNRHYSFVARGDGVSDIELTIPSYKDEYKVMVNGTEYTKEEQTELRNDEKYYLYNNSRSLLFNYTPRSLGDEINIYYVADITLSDYDLEETTPVIPSKYEDEQLEIALIHLVQLATAKFSGGKLEKYQRLRQEYRTNPDETDSMLLTTKRWMKFQPFQYI